MPIIGTAEIQSQEALSRGVLVDHLGYFVARVEWTGSRPMINKTGTPREERRRLLTLDKNPNAANVPSVSARWDFEALDWIVPVDEFVLVNEVTGVPVKRFKGFKERLPTIPSGHVVVDDPFPKARSYRPIYDMEAKAFVPPRRVALVDPDGVVQNVVLENPNQGTPDAPVPEGWERLDDREPWPTDADGNAVGKGFLRKGGVWERPATPN